MKPAPWSFSVVDIYLVEIYREIAHRDKHIESGFPRIANLQYKIQEQVRGLLFSYWHSQKRPSLSACLNDCNTLQNENFPF